MRSGRVLPSPPCLLGSRSDAVKGSGENSKRGECIAAAYYLHPPAFWVSARTLFFPSLSIGENSIAAGIAEPLAVIGFAASALRWESYEK